MPDHRGAVRPNLEYYRKAAKSLLKAAHAGDTAAIARIARVHADAGAPLALHHAQLALAREQGFASWPRFRRFVADFAPDFESVVAQFIDAALDDLGQAEERLALHPEIAGAGFFVALLLGDAAAVERAIAEAPAMATAKGGPRNWEPLLYVCFSRFAAARSPRAASLANTARLLLAHGADPNGSYEDERWPGNPLPCLYGASGLNNNVALTSLLVDAGANLDDGESLYHSSEHSGLECFRLLLARGASARQPNVLNHVLDRENPEGLRLLLAAGADTKHADPHGGTALHAAILRGRSAGLVAMLLDAGAEIDAQRADGRTAYAIAMQRGQTETAKLLAARGADTAISALDRFVGECAAADPADLPRLVAALPDGKLPEEYARLLPDLASSHSTPAVRALLAAGVDVNVMGNDGCTALHWACWKGYADLVKLLLEHHASLTIEDSRFHATPAGWLDHGRVNSHEAGDFALTEQLLRAAGAEIP